MPSRFSQKIEFLIPSTSEREHILRTKLNSFGLKIYSDKNMVDRSETEISETTHNAINLLASVMHGFSAADIEHLLLCYLTQNFGAAEYFRGEECIFIGDLQSMLRNQVASSVRSFSTVPCDSSVSFSSFAGIDSVISTLKVSNSRTSQTHQSS